MRFIRPATPSNMATAQINKELKEVCTDELFIEVMETTTKPHREIALYLRLSEVDSEDISTDKNLSEKMRRVEVLRKWKRQNGSEATSKCLALAFRKMKDVSTAEVIESYYDSEKHHKSPHDQKTAVLTEEITELKQIIIEKDNSASFSKIGQGNYADKDKQEAMRLFMEKFNDTLLKLYRPEKSKYSLWVDRQVRAILGVTFTEAIDIKEVLLKALQVFLGIYDGIIHDHSANLYYYISRGSRLRMKSAHVIQARFSVASFLTLTDALCDRHSLGCNLLHEVKDEMQKCEWRRKDMFKIEEPNTFHSEGSYCIATSSAHDYPIVYLLSQNKAVKYSELLEAFQILDDFLFTECKQEGFSVCILPLVNKDKETLYQVAAVLDCEEFAKHTKKDRATVKEAWETSCSVLEEPRKYYNYLDRL